MEFFWYDYETTGTIFSRDRPVQFAGVRTDAALNPIGSPVSLFCKPARDHLPDVGASLVHGISPQEARARGVTEYEFASRVHELLSKPATCAVGFSAMRFDHHFTRFLFYRNLMDPYAWHWQNGNAKWDIIDLFRAARALRPRGIRWPRNEEGRLSFRQEDLAEENGISTDTPHEAGSDVQVLLALARLIRQRQPRLWNYYLTLRDKRSVEAQLKDTFIYISGSVLYRRQRGTVAALLGRDDRGYVYAFDLAFDPGAVLNVRPDALLEEDSNGRMALHRFRINASPFVVRLSIAGAATPRLRNELRRMDLNLGELRRRYAVLRADPSFLQRVKAAYEARYPADADANQDVDEALYGGGFINGSDRWKLDRLLNSTHDPARWSRLRFNDRRLPELIFRFRARNFPDSLSPSDDHRWREHCRRKLFTSSNAEDESQYHRYMRQIGEAWEGDLDEHSTELLNALEDYGEEMKDYCRYRGA